MIVKLGSLELYLLVVLRYLSLNDRLMNGSNYMPHLIDVLLRFRCHQYTLTADIEKAFLQIEIREEGRDELRFLWLET